MPAAGAISLGLISLLTGAVHGAPPALDDARALQQRGALREAQKAYEEALETLPGVGTATATAILDYRREHGRFSSVDELGDVRGIGPAKLAALRDKVQV